MEFDEEELPDQPKTKRTPKPKPVPKPKKIPIDPCLSDPFYIMFMDWSNLSSYVFNILHFHNSLSQRNYPEPVDHTAMMNRNLKMESPSFKLLTGVTLTVAIKQDHRRYSELSSLMGKDLGICLLDKQRKPVILETGWVEKIATHDPHSLMDEFANVLTIEIKLKEMQP